MRKRMALIATLPKSGTWYCHTFFWLYDQLLSRTWEYLEGQFVPDISQALAGRKISNHSSHRGTLDIDSLFICHVICPGFEKSADARMEDWQTLRFPLPSNWGEPWLRKLNVWDELNPADNHEARIVYLFRNPLDHFISFWEHAQNHVDERQRTRITSDGTRAPIRNLHEFVFDSGMLGAFIKHYYSFRQMHEKFPGRILMMPYERLTLEPQEAFGEILTFFGAPANGMLKERLFKDALAMCSKDSLMAVEAKLGRAIADDQMKGGRHIRDGGIGKWKNYFERDEIENIESVFAAFGISLNEFTTSQDGISPDLQGWTRTIDPELKMQYQQEFFQRQRLNPPQEVNTVAYPNAALRLYKRLVLKASQIRYAVFKPSAVASDEKAM